MVPHKSIVFFQEALLQWDKRHNRRKHIWNEESDPYLVWIREIMLQQTRLEQAKDYYDKFIGFFPNVGALANAPEEKVFKAWEGLGYYSRCRNLIHTAHIISKDYGGQFPNTYEGLIQLKGIGDYTASAMMSFCFGADYAVYDGNVERILARFIGFDKDVRDFKNRKELRTMASKFLPHGKAAIYNQAIMDFGAIVCKPKQPLCNLCPLHYNCWAYKENIQPLIPYKSHRELSKNVYLLFFLLTCNGKVAIQKQLQNILWKQLTLLPFVELSSQNDFDNHHLETILPKLLGFSSQMVSRIIKKKSPLFTQILTHRNVFAHFVSVGISKEETLKMNNCLWIKKESLYQRSFPIIIRKYLAEQGKHLSS